MFTYSANIAINVRDSAKAVNFYTNVLGLVPAQTHNTNSNEVGLKAGPATLWVDGCSKSEEEQVGKVFFEFKVENLEGALKTLKGEGCTLGSETQGEDFRGRIVADPYGMRFHVFQPK